MDQLISSLRTDPLGRNVEPGDRCGSVSRSIWMRRAIDIRTSQVVMVGLLILRALQFQRRLESDQAPNLALADEPFRIDVLRGVI